MSVNRLVGSLVVRVATAALAVLCVSLATIANGGPRLVFYGAIASGVLTWLGLVHSFAGLFKRWMRFAEALHTVVVTVLFTVVYVLVVPLFGVFVWIRDPLRLRRRAGETSWVSRNSNVDAISLERMG